MKRQERLGNGQKKRRIESEEGMPVLETEIKTQGVQHGDESAFKRF